MFISSMKVTHSAYDTSGTPACCAQLSEQIFRLFRATLSSSSLPFSHYSHTASINDSTQCAWTRIPLDITFQMAWKVLKWGTRRIWVFRLVSYFFVPVDDRRSTFLMCHSNSEDWRTLPTIAAYIILKKLMKRIIHCFQHRCPWSSGNLPKSAWESWRTLCIQTTLNRRFVTQFFPLYVSDYSLSNFLIETPKVRFAFIHTV